MTHRSHQDDRDDDLMGRLLGFVALCALAIVGIVNLFCWLIKLL